MCVTYIYGDKKYGKQKKWKGNIRSYISNKQRRQRNKTFQTKQNNTLEENRMLEEITTEIENTMQDLSIFAKTHPIIFAIILFGILILIILLMKRKTKTVIIPQQPQNDKHIHIHVEE